MTTWHEVLVWVWCEQAEAIVTCIYAPYDAESISIGCDVIVLIAYVLVCVIHMLWYLQG